MMRLALLGQATLAFLGMFACRTASTTHPTSDAPGLEVRLHDFTTGRPLAGQEITIEAGGGCGRRRDCVPTPVHRLVTKTDDDGTARFDTVALEVPAGAFQLHEVRVEGYETRCPFHNISDAEKTYALWTDATTPKGLRVIDCKLVSIASLKVATGDQAFELANDLPEVRAGLPAHPGLAVVVKRYSAEWQVAWQVGDSAKVLVLVDAIGGNARVLGRWSN